MYIKSPLNPPSHQQSTAALSSELNLGAFARLYHVCFLSCTLFEAAQVWDGLVQGAGPANHSNYKTTRTFSKVLKFSALTKSETVDE